MRRDLRRADLDGLKEIRPSHKKSQSGPFYRAADWLRNRALWTFLSNSTLALVEIFSTSNLQLLRYAFVGNSRMAASTDAIATLAQNSLPSCFSRVDLDRFGRSWIAERLIPRACDKGFNPFRLRPFHFARFKGKIFAHGFWTLCTISIRHPMLVWRIARFQAHR